VEAVYEIFGVNTYIIGTDVLPDSVKTAVASSDKFREANAIIAIEGTDEDLVSAELRKVVADTPNVTWYGVRVTVGRFGVNKLKGSVYYGVIYNTPVKPTVE
jgi:hypothetical protein